MEFEDDERHAEEEEEEDDDEDEEIMGRLPPSYDSSCLVLSQGPKPRPRYRECLKNHAVGLGGHALDGCGEFLAAGPEGTLDALKCAACNCHRNFHRKDDFSSGGGAGGGHPSFPFSPFYRAPSGYLHVAPLRPLALPSTSGGGRAEEQDDGGGGSSSGRKRFRTKFTGEQKEKMLELAERLGWRIQKHDEAVVQQFCNDSGVKRQVLKVWMHNNKHTLGKKNPN